MIKSGTNYIKEEDIIYGFDGLCNIIKACLIKQKIENPDAIYDFYNKHNINIYYDACGKINDKIITLKIYNKLFNFLEIAGDAFKEKEDEKLLCEITLNLYNKFMLAYNYYIKFVLKLDESYYITIDKDNYCLIGKDFIVGYSIITQK